MKGLSRANLFYMRAFAEAYPDREFVQQVAGQLPWFHNVTILTKVKDSLEREWYLRACTEHGWSRAVLLHQIESGLYHRQGKALTNFARTLPAPQSELAQQLLKDPDSFDFLSTHDALLERDLHKKLVEHLRDFMVELGVGFSFVGSQVHLEVGGEDFYLDLLFYHLKLRCFVVVELKTTEFKPEYAGKLNFYLSAVDDLLRHPQDNPTVGILLCKERNRVVVEYALRGSIDAAEYKHVVLGLIFLKYISDAFEEHRKKLLAEPYADPEEPDEYRGDNIFWVPLKAPWSELQRNARDPSIGQLVDQAMESVENYELEPQYRSCCHKPFNICYGET